MYSLGVMPYFFLKQVLKYFGSLKPTATARSVILILLRPSISLQAAVSRTFKINAEGVNPVNDFSFSVSTVREAPHLTDKLRLAELHIIQMSIHAVYRTLKECLVK